MILFLFERGEASWRELERFTPRRSGFYSRIGSVTIVISQLVFTLAYQDINVLVSKWKQHLLKVS